MGVVGWVWFRKGACENCGAMTHKKKDCLEVGGCGQEPLIKDTFHYSMLHMYGKFIVCTGHRLQCKTLHFTKHKLYAIQNIQAHLKSILHQCSHEIPPSLPLLSPSLPQRPRKVGAKFSNKNLRPDEYLHPKLTLTYDGKRDRWNGYNTDEHQAVVEEYAKVEMAKRQLKAERLQTDLLDGKLSETSIKVGRQCGVILYIPYSSLF